MLDKKPKTFKKHKHNGIEYLSYGEVEIAKFLDSLNIEFEYEFPIAVVEYDKPKLWYPDFYLKEYQVVVEYFGRYNYDETYKGAADHKKEVFKKCGIQFVALYHINNNWQEYLLNTVLAHQETKVKKINNVLDSYNKENGSFINRLKNFLVLSKEVEKKSNSKPNFPKVNSNLKQTNIDKIKTKKIDLKNKLDIEIKTKEVEIKPKKIKSKSNQRIKYTKKPSIK